MKKTKKKSETMFDFIYRLMDNRPFCGCSRKTENKKIYDAYCLRIAETITDEWEEKLENFYKGEPSLK